MEIHTTGKRAQRVSQWVSSSFRNDERPAHCTGRRKIIVQ